MTAKPRSAFWVPLFDELADPLVVARLAAEAEEVGWNVFLRVVHLTWGMLRDRSTIPAAEEVASA